MNKHFFIKILKIIITLVLLVYVITKINFSQLYSVLKSIDIIYYFIAFVLSLIGFMFLSWRWQMLLKVHSYDYSIKSLFKLSVISTFFNFFMLGTIGGDIYKISKVSRDKDSIIKPLTSVFMDRIIGLTSFLIIIVFSLIFGQKLLNDQIFTVVIIFIFLILGTLSILFNKKIVLKILVFFRPLINKIRFIDLNKKIENLYGSIMIYFDNKNYLYYALSLSLLYQIIQILISYSLLLSFNIKVPLLYLAVILPIVSILTMIPVTLYGFGIRETSFIYFLGILGITASQTLSFLLAGYSITLFYGVYGGVMYLATKIKST